MREAEFLDKALAIVKAAGYRVSKPRSQPSRPQRPDGLNAVGKPYGANDDPNYKLKGVGASIGRLYAPYGPSMRFVGDQRDNTKRARRAFHPVPPLSHSFIEPECARSCAQKDDRERRAKDTDILAGVHQQE